MSDTEPGFGVDAFDTQVTANQQGDPFTQAGGHPYSASTYIDFNTLTNPDPLLGDLWPVEPTRKLVVDLPPGFIGNPTAATKCTAPELAESQGIGAMPLCAPTSQVGTTFVRLNGASLAGVENVIGPLPVFNMVPPPDAPARFGFNIDGTIITLDASLRSDGDYGVTVHAEKLPESLPIAGSSFTLWGVPSDPSHDSERACPGQENPSQGGPSCSSGAPPKAFLRLPTSCPAPGVGLPTSLHIDSWVNPGVFQDATVLSHLPPAYPAAPEDRGPDQGTTGCDNVPFSPTFTGVAASPTRAGEPSGFTVDIDVPQSDDPTGIGEGDIKKVVSTLPAGMSVSPSAADGLGACSEAQVGLHSTADASCPDNSKVGSLSITTPLLDTPLTGSIYLATPHANPFNSLIALYLVAKGSGVIIKLAGEVQADPNTGQLTATFDNQPQAPLSKLHLSFDGGPRASLVAPQHCGTYTTKTQLTSWSGASVESDSSFDVSADGHGAPCPPPTFSPKLVAGTQNPIAGKTSPFVLSLTRTDQDQNFSTLSVNTPTGLLGKIKNTVLCSDAAANAGTCGDGSKVGTVSTGAGPGPNPFYITNGRAYITGPYKGAPYGLSIVVPAVAGPFDLGNVVVRAAIFVDRNTAGLRVDSDRLPTILQGIPLDVRDVRVAIDKPDFIVNPTSCAQKHVLATVGSTEGMFAHVGSRFEVADCAALRLAPKFTMTVGAKHRTRAGVSTPLTTTITQTPGQSNLRSVKVTLPTSLDALLPVVNRACSLADFQAGHCTNRTRVGSAVAVTPLLKDPLRGSVYFVKNPKRILPDLMVALRGEVSLDLTGKVSIPGGKRLATTFDTIPDAAITKFTLRIVAGTNGPVGITTNLCSARARRAAAAISIRGQNGRRLTIHPRPHVNGCPKR